MVLNEPVAFCGAGYFLGVHAPGMRGRDSFIAASHHAALATAAGARALKVHNSKHMVGSTYSFSPVTPYTQSEKDCEAALRVHDLLNYFFLFPALGLGYPLQRLKFLDSIEKYFKPGDDAALNAGLDFIGVQNYTREVVKHSWFTPYIRASVVSARRRRVPLTEMGWEIYPEGIYMTLKQLSQIRGIPPLIITENGAAFSDDIIMGETICDTARIDYLERYINQVMRAKNDGIDVRGYFLWSLTDNFEWSEGYRPRFGIVHIDYDNGLKRTIRQSGHWYADRILR